MLDFFRGTAIDFDGDIPAALQELGLDWKPALSFNKHGEMFQYLNRDNLTMYRPEDGQFMGNVGRHWFDACGTLESVLENFKQFTKDNDITLEKVGKTQRLVKGRDDYRLEVNLYATALLTDPKCKTDLGVGDTVSSRILLFYPFRSGAGIQVRSLIERLVCTNGMTVASGVTEIIRHSSLATDKVQRALQAAHDTAAGVVRDFEVLAQTQMPHEVAVAKLIEVFGDPTRSADNQPRILKQLLDRWDTQRYIGADMLSAYNTAWGLLNLVTEYYNHQYGRAKDSQTRMAQLLDSTAAVNTQQQSFLASINSFAHAERQRQNGRSHVPVGVAML